jgi:serine protease inhibitor
MRKWRCFRSLSTGVVLLLTSAVVSGAYGEVPGIAAHTGAAIDPQIVTSDNAFGVALFKTLSTGNNGNIAISPVSIALALQIAYNGAVGTTRHSMAQTLLLGSLATQRLNKANAALQASLRVADPQVQITIANSLWVIWIAIRCLPRSRRPWKPSTVPRSGICPRRLPM